MHVFVVKVGDPPYAQYTLPFIQDYCARWRYPLTIFDQPSADGRHPCWQKLLAHTVVGEEHVLILDLDVAPLPYAPPITSELDVTRLAMVAERRREHRMGLIKSLGFPDDGVIYNSGVLGAPPQFANFFGFIRSQEHLDRTGEQLHLNLHIARDNLPVQRLDERWNWNVRGAFNPHAHSHLIWFAHFAGRASRRLEKSRELWEYWYGNHSRPRGHVRIIYELLRDVLGAPHHGAEVGVAEGELSAALLGAFPTLRLQMIDAWSCYPPAHSYRLSGDSRAKLTPEAQVAAMNQAIQRTSFAKDRARIVRLDSRAAADQLGDGTLDFVFIDADHSYEGCRRDLEAYFPKVRSGGLLSGHDYGHRRFHGVKRAVDEFFGHCGLHFDVRESVWSARKP